MNDERHDLDEILRTHGGAPDHLPSFEARLTAGLVEADREMGRATGGRLRWPRGSRSLWARHPVLASATAVGTPRTSASTSTRSTSRPSRTIVASSVVRGDQPVSARWIASSTVVLPAPLAPTIAVIGPSNEQSIRS